MREREKKAHISKIHRCLCLWFAELDICGPHIFPIYNNPKIWAVKNELMTHITGHAGSNKLDQKNKPHANWARQKQNSGKGKENALPRRMPACACEVAAAVGSFVGRRSSERWPEWNPPLSSREAFVPTTCQLAMEVESGLQKKKKSSDSVNLQRSSSKFISFFTPE